MQRGDDVAREFRESDVENRADVRDRFEPRLVVVGDRRELDGGMSGLTSGLVASTASTASVITATSRDRSARSKVRNLGKVEHSG